MSRIPTLLGPVITGASFMFASVQNGEPFILNGSPTGGILRYYWEPNITILGQSRYLPIFTANGTVESVTISDSTNGGFLGFIGTSLAIVNTTSPTTVKMEQTLFTNWFPPDIFLSAVQYTLMSSRGATADVYTSATGTILIPANNLIVLPIVWYGNCTTSGSYDIINTPGGSVINWMCLVNPQIAGCSDQSLLPHGWTNLRDCMAGNLYTYCSAGQLCGANGCNGPCNVSYYDCDPSAGTYVCTFNPNEFFESPEWWENPYFIGITIAGVVVVIIIVAIIYRFV